MTRIVGSPVLVGSLGMAFLLVACGSNGASTGDLRSGVRGTVVAGPTCPVETEASPCPDAPIEAELTFRGGSTTDNVTSAKDGTFEIKLPAGDYVVTGEPVSGAMFCKQDEVTVEPDAFASLTFACDTGIR